MAVNNLGVDPSAYTELNVTVRRPSLSASFGFTVGPLRGRPHVIFKARTGHPIMNGDEVIAMDGNSTLEMRHEELVAEICKQTEVSFTIRRHQSLGLPTLPVRFDSVGNQTLRARTTSARSGFTRGADSSERELPSRRRWTSAGDRSRRPSSIFPTKSGTTQNEASAIHKNIMNVGSDVVAAVEMEYCRQREAAVSDALSIERRRAQAQLEAELAAVERKAEQKLAAALDHERQLHAAEVARLEQHAAINKSEALRRASVAAAAEQDRQLVAQHTALVKEHEKTMAAAMKQRDEDALAQAEVFREAAVASAVAETAAEHSSQNEVNRIRYAKDCDKRVINAQTVFKTELAQLQAMLDNEHTMNAELRQRVNEANTKLAEGEQAYKSLIADFRATLSTKLPSSTTSKEEDNTWIL